MTITVIAIPANHNRVVAASHPTVVTVHAPFGDIGTSTIGRHLLQQTASGDIDRRAASIIDTTALLVTDRITEVIVDDAARLPARAIDWLNAATLAAGTNLTLAHRSPFNTTTAAWLATWPHQQRGLARHQARWRHPANPPAKETFPTVPDSDWPWFRTDLSNLIASDQETVDRVYLAALGTAVARFARYRQPASTQAFTVVRSMLTGITDANWALTVVRAVAAAGFEHGVAIKVTAARLRWALQDTRPPSPARADRAIAIAAAVASIPITDLAAYTVADADRLAHAVPASYQRDVRRQTLARRLHGALLTDPLITTPTGQPSSIAALTQTVRRQQPTTPGRPRLTRSTWDSNRAWAQHIGISVHRYRPA